jgi:hypothetical protein
MLKHIKFYQVRKTGTRGKQLQMECQEIWNVSLADINFVDSNSFNSSMVVRNVKVRFYLLKLIKAIEITQLTLVFHKMPWSEPGTGKITMIINAQ